MNSKNCVLHRLGNSYCVFFQALKMAEAGIPVSNSWRRISYFHCSLVGYFLGLLTATVSSEVSITHLKKNIYIYNDLKKVQFGEVNNFIICSDLYSFMIILQDGNFQLNFLSIFRSSRLLNLLYCIWFRSHYYHFLQWHI